ncbi:MAG: hypothetical protein ABH829_01595 [archaeon]
MAIVLFNSVTLAFSVPIFAGAAAGFIRAFLGYLKARYKNGEAFVAGKFVQPIIFSAGVGAAIGYYMSQADPLFIGAVAIAGSTLIDSIVWVFVGKKKPQAD